MPHAVGNMALQRLLHSGAIQPKLTVNPPGDIYEQEADRVAEEVVSGAQPSGALSTAEPAVQRLCAECAAGGECPRCREEEERVQAKAAPGRAPAVPSGPRPLAAGLRGRGQPMPAAARAFFEPRFSQDFGHVRVHTDGPATQSARSLNARAYTLGSDIVFGAGEYAPESREGQRLLAHELTHVVQQSRASAPPARLLSDRGDPAEREAAAVSRGIETAAGVSPGAAPSAWIHRDEPAGGPNPFSMAPPPNRKWPTTGETATFIGIDLTENPDQLRDEMLWLVARGISDAMIPAGILAPSTYLNRILVTTAAPMVCGEPGSPGYDDCRRREILRTKIVPPLTRVVASLYEQHQKNLKKFEKQAKENAKSVLKAQKEQAIAEGIRYGIKSEQIEALKRDPLDDSPRAKMRDVEAHHDMPKDSPAGKGLQGAAKVLLKRREELTKKSSELSGMVRAVKDDGLVFEPDVGPEYNALRAEITKLEKEYDDLRDQLSIEYPVLASFSERGKSTANLETLAEKGTGPDMAGIIAEDIADKLSKNETVSRGLDDGGVNVWRLPRIVGLTKAQLGLDKDPVQKALLAEKERDEQPGILIDVALFVLNVLAIALAGVTGGLSLAVAAGVNAVVAAEHVQEYLMQEALAGTAFHKANALSQEEPSLFWLALEIVGVVMDVGGAAAAMFKTFKSLAPLVKTAQAAKEGESAVTTLQAVRTAAQDAHGAAFAEKVVAQVKSARGGEAVALRAAGATPEEIKILQAAGRAADAEAAVSIGKGVKTATGEVKMSKAGHLFSCDSPCALIREKYSSVFAKSDDTSKQFLAELNRIETEAETAAKAHAAAKASNNADELAKAEATAQRLEKEAAELEKRIQQAHPHLTGIPDDEAAIGALKQAEAETEVTKGRLPAEANELEKMKPALDKPPAGVSPEDPLWRDYVDYFNTRLEAIKSGKQGVQGPLRWTEYEDFLRKFRRGTKYQEKVLGELAEEAKLPAGERKLFGEMQDPFVESNVGVAGKTEGATTKFVDQLVIDRATLGPGKTPNVQAFSNKSRTWPDKLGATERASVRAQVIADAEEALTKYGGEINIRRPGGMGPEKDIRMFKQTVKVSKVTLVYDKALVKTPEMERFIEQAAAGVKVGEQNVTVIFR